MAASPIPRRRPPKIDTQRMEAIRSSARHLKDLQRAHKRPPANVEVNARGVPKFVPPIIEQSYCTSPAALCAELAEEPMRAATPRVETAEPIDAAALCGDLEEEAIDDDALWAEFAEEPAQ